MKPLLSIIIISYNTADITIDCLNSVIKDKGLHQIPFEIIIVDNNSHDDSVKKIEKFKNSLKLNNCRFIIITNDFNGGFGKANNQGIKIAQGNYILLLNSDTIILHSAISQALDWLCSHPESSTCTAQLLNRDKTIQASGGFFPTLTNVITWSLNLDDLPFINKIIKPLHPHTPTFYTKDKFYLTDHPQDWVTGAFFLTRKPLLDKIDGFDESYFMYGEEVELAYRISKTTPNNQVWYLVGPQIIHLGGASATSRLDPILNEYRGILSFFKKHRPQWQYPIVRFMLKINAFIRSIIHFSPLYLQACSKI
ncbi:MAG: glycosyltransferase family 2 protein [Candidatus Shapirobacteria bacterium]|nr:glycosyltransferase family 2 protein [Candidatus Shapirobacteria bacterium]